MQSSSGKPEEKTKELPASNVFTAMISRSLKEESGTLVLQKGNTTELGVVATDTAKALGDTVSRAFGLPSKKNLLLTLGLCGVDLNLKMTRAFVTKDYKAADVLAITTGSHVALWQIIRGARQHCREPPLPPSHGCCHTLPSRSVQNTDLVVVCWRRLPRRLRQAR